MSGKEKVRADYAKANKYTNHLSPSEEEHGSGDFENAFASLCSIRGVKKNEGSRVKQSEVQILSSLLTYNMTNSKSIKHS
jgi:hypothetical protein